MAKVAAVAACVVFVLVVTGHGPQLVACAFVLAIGYVALGKHAPGRRVRMYRYKPRRSGNADVWIAARHEAGHAIVARKLGGTVTKCEVYANGSGVTGVKRMRNLIEEIAVTYAGEYAAHTSRGCSGDHALTRYYLRLAPSSERARVHRAGRALARRMVSSHSGAISSAARRLERRGRL